MQFAVGHPHGLLSVDFSSVCSVDATLDAILSPAAGTLTDFSVL
jgi:hypothetical protein